MRIYKTILIICIALVVGFILYNSTRTGEQSSKISSGVSDKIVETVIPDYSQMESAEKQTVSTKMHLTVRNLAHAVEFFAFTFFLALLLFTCKLNHGRYPIAMAITLFTAFAFALIDELLQGAFAGRGTDIIDVGMDVLGSTVAILCALIADAVGCKIFKRERD